MKQFFFVFFLSLSNLLFAGYKTTGKKVDGEQYLRKKQQERITNDLVVKERLGELVKKDIILTNSDGNGFVLGDIFQEKNIIPWVVVFVYFRCPKLCGTVLDGLVENLLELRTKKAGRDYRLLIVSIDPTDTYQDADSYKKRLSKIYREQFSGKKKKFNFSSEDWTFAVGSEKQVTEFAKLEIGFPYSYNKEINEFEHPANFFILTPNGKISRYFYGIGVKNSFDLNLALAEAKMDKFRSTLEKVMLYCYRFDGKGYALHGLFIMKIFGTIVLISVLIFLCFLIFSKNKKLNQRNN